MVKFFRNEIMNTQYTNGQNKEDKSFVKIRNTVIDRRPCQKCVLEFVMILGRQA